MSDLFVLFVLQRPIFDTLDRYLSTKDLLKVVTLNRQIYDFYKDDVLVWYKYCKKSAKLACYLNRLDVIQLMNKKNDNAETLFAMQCAAFHGRLEILKWLCENRTDCIIPDIAYLAACGGHLEIIKWFHQNNHGITLHAIDGAVIRGHMKILQFLHNNLKERWCSRFAMKEASRKGYYEIVKFLHKYRCYEQCWYDRRYDRR